MTEFRNCDPIIPSWIDCELAPERGNFDHYHSAVSENDRLTPLLPLPGSTETENCATSGSAQRGGSWCERSERTRDCRQGGTGNDQWQFLFFFPLNSVLTHIRTDCCYLKKTRHFNENHPCSWTRCPKLRWRKSIAIHPLTDTIWWCRLELGPFWTVEWLLKISEATSYFIVRCIVRFGRKWWSLHMESHHPVERWV